MGNGAGVTDARQDEITRRRLVAVAVTVVCLVALIVLVGGLGSPSRGDPGARHSASKGVSANARASGNLLPGSDPSVLPGPVLIADRDNNRLLEVSPTGQVLWRFPEAGDLAPGQSFELPDDAFYSPNGREVVVTQEDDFVISVVDVTHPRIVFRYGHPGVPGSEPGYLHNPDDAMLTPGGAILCGGHQELPFDRHPPAGPSSDSAVGRNGQLHARARRVLWQPQRSLSHE